MKKLAALLIALTLFTGCGLIQKISHKDNNENIENTLGASYMRFTMNKVLGISQVDSMIVVDHLSPLDEWLVINIKGPNKENILEYMFIRSLDTDNELIYTATQMDVDTLYKCTKRITEKITLE